MSKESKHFYRSSNDFRLGAGQYDDCPHSHRTPGAAARCTWWSRRYASTPSVVREQFMRDGKLWTVGALSDVGYGQ